MAVCFLSSYRVKLSFINGIYSGRLYIALGKDDFICRALLKTICTTFRQMKMHNPPFLEVLLMFI